MTTISTLTLTGMLRDPLIKLVMRSDGVSDDDFSALLFRVKDTMIAQGRMPEAAQPSAGG